MQFRLHELQATLAAIPKIPVSLELKNPFFFFVINSITQFSEKGLEILAFPSNQFME